jgi:hypothetical protein
MRVLRYMGGTAAPKRAARVSNRKLSLFSELADDVVVVVRQPLKKEASTPSHLLVRVQPHDSSRRSIFSKINYYGIAFGSSRRYNTR